MAYHVYHQFVLSGDVQLYTTVCLPEKEGKFPMVLCRSPYVDEMENMSDEEIYVHTLELYEDWLRHGYGFIYQHCRGRGRSEGDCIPYVHERADSLSLQEWVRLQPFYNGEIYLFGRSYTTSVAYLAAPYAPDIKAMVLEVQDFDNYNCSFRNGFYKIGLEGNWFVGMYKKKSHRPKHYVRESFNMLPLSEFTNTVLGERAEVFDEILRHPKRDDPFWETLFDGEAIKEAIRHAHIPILLATGFYDIYTGGMFDMWRSLDDETKSLSALVVTPYSHSSKDDCKPLAFDKGAIPEAFGDYRQLWISAVRGKADYPFPRGQITYYRLFENTWKTDDFDQPQKSITFPLGSGDLTYRYNPYAPASFPGGLSANFGGTAFQDPPFSRPDILTLYTPEFTEDTFIKGKASAKLCVKSTCEDTCFYVRLSLCMAEGDYGLRDDITQLSNVNAQYVPGEELMLDFTFDEHAILIRKGQKIRIDISSSAFPHYVRHTNNRGLFCDQTTAKIADNTVILSKSSLTLPVE